MPRRVRGSPFADIDAYLAQQGLLSAATGTGEVDKVQVPIFSQNHRQSRGIVPRASPCQGRSRKSHAASRPVASPQVNGAIRERNAKRSHQSPFATCDSDESNGASGPCRVDMTNSNGCPALEDAKDAKGSAGSVEDSDLFDRTQLIQLGRMDERAAPAPIRSKHFPNSQMSQPETAKKPKLDLSSLSAEQREAISEPLNSPLLILAGPGSGKTHFLVTRIRQALSESVPAEGIIAVTYTRKAADELSHRVKQHAGAGEKVWVSTVHGLALRFLREAGGRSGAPCKAASDEDRRAAAGVVLGQPQLQELFSYLEALPDSEGSATGDAAQASKKYGQTVAKLLSVFDQKGRWLANSVQDVSQQPLLVTAHQAFLQELRKQRLLDISEVIEAASRLQQADAESSSRWVASFAQMLFVDEWQDIDTEQQDFLARLLGRQGHITAVGDDDQRIYAWRDRGASAPEAFRKHWSSACIKTLGANHRALPHLVEAATRLISHNSHREKKELRSARQDVEQPGRVSVVAKECLNAEARWVAEEIQRGDAKSFGASAILTRTNASATVFAKALSQLGLPVWPSARKGVTDGPRTSQVLDLLAYLRLVVDPHHDPSFLRICNVPRRGVGKAALRCLREQFGAPAETSLSTFQGVEDLNVEQAALRARSLAGGVDGEPASGSFEGAMGRLLKAPWLGSSMRLAQGLAKLAAVLRAARRAAAAEHGAADVLRVILVETGLGSGSSGSISAGTEAKAATGSGRKSESTEASPASPAALQLMAAAEKYVDGQNGAACVVRFLQEMAPRGSGHAASTSSVFVSTIHQAKGLEWDTVFLVQCNEMVMPLQRQGMQMADEQLEEERRLFYVAMTRARNRLVLSFSLKRDSGEAAEPSRFLFETGAMDTMDTTDTMHTLDLGDGDSGSVVGTNPEEPPEPVLKRRKTWKTWKTNEFFQTGLEVRSIKEAQVLARTDRAPSGMQSWIPKALESEQALCASFFGTDCLQK